MNNKIDPCDTMRVNLIAAAVGLQQCTKTASNIIPIPGGDRVIAIGTPAQVRGMLADDPGALARVGQQAGETGDLQVAAADLAEGLRRDHRNEVLNWDRLLDAANMIDDLRAQLASAQKDAIRYRVLRQNVRPGDVSISNTERNVPPSQSPAARIDMLCDQYIARAQITNTTGN